MTREGSDESMIPLDLDVDVGSLDLAAARDAVLRHRRPKEYVIRTVLGIALLCGVGVFYAKVEDRENVAPAAAFLTFLALSIVPWTYQRMSAWITGLKPYTIVGLLPHGIRVRSKHSESEQRFEALPIRLETKSLFVLSTADGSGVLTIPKRVFPSADMLASVRAALFGPSLSPATMHALRVFGETASVRFAMTPEEIRSTWKLLLGPTFTLGLWIVGAFLVVGLAYVFYARGPLEGTIVAVVLVVGLRQGITPARTPRGAAPAETTFEIDTDVFRLTSATGSTVTYPWNTAPRIDEDDKLLIIVTQTGSVPIPKRVLNDEMSALIRSRVASVRS
jgi:hypothetical protein